jgi:hypothetical protein
MIAFDLHSPSAPAEILAALRAHAGEWRQSQIPTELSTNGICAVECRKKGSVCTQLDARRWGAVGARGLVLRAQATVEALADGTCIRVVVRQDVLANSTLPFMGAGFGTLIGVVALGPGALLFPLLPLSVIGVGYLWLRVANRDLSRSNDPAADYLARRIEEVVMHADDMRKVASLAVERDVRGALRAKRDGAL